MRRQRPGCKTASHVSIGCLDKYVTQAGWWHKNKQARLEGRALGVCSLIGKGVLPKQSLDNSVLMMYIHSENCFITINPCYSMEPYESLPNCIIILQMGKLRHRGLSDFPKLHISERKVWNLSPGDLVLQLGDGNSSFKGEEQGFGGKSKPCAQPLGYPAFS